MNEQLIKELRELLEKAYYLSNDSKISLYLHLVELFDYYSDKTTVERKNRIKKEYGL